MVRGMGEVYRYRINGNIFISCRILSYEEVYVRFDFNLKDVQEGYEETTAKNERFWYGFKNPYVFMVSVGDTRYAYVTDKSKVVEIDNRPFNTVLSSRFVQKTLVIRSILYEYFEFYRYAFFEKMPTPILEKCSLEEFTKFLNYEGVWLPISWTKELLECFEKTVEFVKSYPPKEMLDTMLAVLL